MTTPNKINFPPPKLQIDFAFALKRFRAVYLQSALLETVLKKHTEPPRAQRAPRLLRLASLAILATMTILFSVYTSNEFIYFKF